MGYRSDVAIQIYGGSNREEALTKITELKRFIKESFDELSDPSKGDINSLISSSEQDTGKDFWITVDGVDELFFFASDVKWYEGFVDVDYFEAIVEKARDIDLNVEYIRIGEETDDIIMDFSGDDCEYRMSVNRSIDYF
jgi:hypothetical protein